MMPEDSALVDLAIAACIDESAAVRLLESLRWPNGAGSRRDGALASSRRVRCVKCEGGDVYPILDRAHVTRSTRFLWCCRACSHQFTVRAGTFLQDSRVPLHRWCRAFWLLSAHTRPKDGLAPIVARDLRVSRRTAMRMIQRFDDALGEGDGLARTLKSIMSKARGLAVSDAT